MPRSNRSKAVSRRLFLLTLASGVGSAVAATSTAQHLVYLPITLTTSTPLRGHPTPGTCLTSAEAELAGRINAFRAEYALPSVPPTKSLAQVAQAHMIDLYENHPYGGVDSRGQPCNMHSWSSKGAWSPVCYTADHFYAQGMWDKPREITLNMYQGNGYENAYGGAGDDPNIAANAMRAWRSDPGHADVIVERGIWKNMRWPAMGVGIYHGFAVLWFGNSADPQGALDQCQ